MGDIPMNRMIRYFLYIGGFLLFVYFIFLIIAIVGNKASESFVSKDMINDRLVDMSKDASSLCLSRGLSFAGVYMIRYDKASALCYTKSPCRMIELDIDYENKK